MKISRKRFLVRSRGPVLLILLGLMLGAPVSVHAGPPISRPVEDPHAGRPDDPGGESVVNLDGSISKMRRSCQARPASLVEGQVFSPMFLEFLLRWRVGV